MGIECDNMPCRWWDSEEPRNCQNWNPLKSCGFINKTSVNLAPIGVAPVVDYDKIEAFFNEVKDDTSVLHSQVGGGHYKDLAIQPIEFCQLNEFNMCESSIIKYVVRHKNKNGLEDLKKARHFLEILMELEYGYSE